MPYTLHFIEADGVLLVTWVEPFDFLTTINTLSTDLHAALDDQPHQLWVLLELGNPQLNMQEMFALARMMRQGEESVMYHPQVYHVLWITNNSDLAAAAIALCEAADQADRVRVFESRDAALAFIRAAV